MTIVLTKIWGFDAPVGPLQFSTQGWRGNAAENLHTGDLVVLVGTMGLQTPDDMKGRLLGIMEPTTEPVMSLDFDLRQHPSDFVDGAYKWPFGLMNRRAWSLPDRPLLSELTDRKFSMDSAQGIVPLTDAEAARVLALRRIEEPLLRPTASAQERMNKKHGVAKRTAPPPTTTRVGIMHMRRSPAYTYAMEVKRANASAFKIGWAFDVKQRAGQFNHAAMPGLGGLHYVPIWTHLWDSARQAFQMEQRMLAHFEWSRSATNSEIIIGVTRKDLDAAWYAGVGGKL